MESVNDSVHNDRRSECNDSPLQRRVLSTTNQQLPVPDSSFWYLGRHDRYERYFNKDNDELDEVEDGLSSEGGIEYNLDGVNTKHFRVQPQQEHTANSVHRTSRQQEGYARCYGHSSQQPKR